MRREPATVVALVGAVDDDLLAALGRSPNVSVARAPDTDPGQPPARAPAAVLPGWEAGALAMREAARRRSTYVIVPSDPLAGVAASWQAMWDLGSAPDGAAFFEAASADALAAWQGERFELPDYYLVVTPDQANDSRPDLYLGPLRAVRPRRVAVAPAAHGPDKAARLADALRSLGHGPWWPPLDQVIDAARQFNAAGLAETQQPPLAVSRETLR